MPAILKVRSVTQNGSHFFPDIHNLNSERVVFITGGTPIGGPMGLSVNDIREGHFAVTHMLLDLNLAEKDQVVRDAMGGEPGIPTETMHCPNLKGMNLKGEDVNPITHAWFLELKDKDGNVETILTNTAAWLMSDSGKTLDRFYRE